MNRILGFLLIGTFSVFLGSQITEGCVLVPYWKTLSPTQFYEYYTQFGPVIARFYTILTIIAVLIPMGTSMHCFSKKSRALKYALISSFFALLVIALFYSYFKGANQLFYDVVLDSNQLKSELEVWSYWHWVRVLFELLSLIFLILTFSILTDKKDSINGYRNNLKQI